VAAHSHPEVHQSDVTTFEKNVFERDIAVTNAMPMKVVNCLGQLPHVLLDLCFCQASGCSHIEELPTIGKLSYEPCEAVLRVCSQHFQQVWRQIWLPAQVRQDSNLGQCILSTSTASGISVNIALIRLGVCRRAQRTVPELFDRNVDVVLIATPPVFVDVSIDAWTDLLHHGEARFAQALEGRGVT
jgi:hypothetical protein